MCQTPWAQTGSVAPEEEEPAPGGRLLVLP